MACFRYRPFHPATYAVIGLLLGERPPESDLWRDLASLCWKAPVHSGAFCCLWVQYKPEGVEVAMSQTLTELFTTAAHKTAAPAEESQYHAQPMGRPDESGYTRDQGVHRGLSVVLRPEVHKFVHDPNQPPAAKAHLLLSEVRKQNAQNQGPEGEEGSTGGLGNYWSPSPHKAAEYANQTGWGTYNDHERKHNCGDEESGHGGCPTTHIVMHAETPPDKHHWHENMRPGEKYDPEISWRLPVRPGAPMKVTGVSWREGNDHWSSGQKYSEEGMKFHTGTPFNRYDFSSPVRKQADLEARYDGGDIPSRFLNQHGIRVRVHTAGHPNVEMVPTHELAPYATQETDGDHAREVATHFAEKGYMEPLMLQYHPKTGEAYLGEGNHRLRAARVLGMDHVPVRVSRNMFGLAGKGAPAPARHPAEATGEHIPSEIKPSEIGFSAKPLEPRTAGVSFGLPRQVGESQYEEDDGFHKRMWDQWHPKLQSRVYRHLALDLPSSHPAHNEKLPVDERARAVLQHTLTKGNVGVHWTDDPGYHHLNGDRLSPGQTAVVLHADTPERHHIEDNSYVLEDRAVRDWDMDPEREVPLKRNAPMNVRGITWHSARGPVTHTFDNPIRVHAAKDPDEVTCAQGHDHWGARGAAGLLVRHTDLEGTHHYLLQQRSRHVDHPGTWSIPGGAIERGETPFEAGTREGDEELGGLPPLGHIGTHSNDHGGWSYHTVIADTPEKFTPSEDGSHSHEAAGHRWFTAPQIDEMHESGELHPGFAESWPEVRHRAETEVPHRQMRLFTRKSPQFVCLTRPDLSDPEGVRSTAARDAWTTNVYAAQKAMTEGGHDLQRYGDLEEAGDHARQILHDHGHPQAADLAVRPTLRPNHSYVVREDELGEPDEQLRLHLGSNHFHNHAVLHEMAHLLTSGGHGQDFVDTFRGLLGHYGHHNALRTFDEHFQAPAQHQGAMEADEEKRKHTQNRWMGGVPEALQGGSDDSGDAGGDSGSSSSTTAAYTPPGTMGTDNEGHRVQMTTMDGWAHDDGSHGHEDNTTIGDHPVYTHTHTWLPEGRYWGPNSAQNDQRIFEGDHLRPEVRQDILDRVGRVLGHLYDGWETWAKVYFAGSEAAKWQPFNGDFDVLIGIDWTEFRDQNPDHEELDDAEIAQQMTDALWSKANVDNYFFELADGRKVGPFDRTFFVNPRAWDIRNLKPYAAYDVTDDTWAVHPLEVPKDWSATHLPESYWDYAETLLHEIEAIGRLPEEERQRMAANLWEELHTHRSDAFTGNGKGLFDLSNVVEKYLDQHPDRPWERLREWKNSSPTGPSPWVPTTARRTLSGLFSQASGTDGDGIMIAIVPPKSIGRKLLVEDGEPLEALHVTLCYLGSKTEHSKDQVAGLDSLVRAWARTQKPFKASVGGAGTFTNPGNHVLWAAVDIPGGGAIRHDLNELLVEHGYKVRNDHGWTPHITLKYHNSHVRFLPKVEPATWDVKEIMLCIGGSWEPVKLGA